MFDQALVGLRNPDYVDISQEDAEPLLDLLKASDPTGLRRATSPELEDFSQGTENWPGYWQEQLKGAVRQKSSTPTGRYKDPKYSTLFDERYQNPDGTLKDPVTDADIAEYVNSPYFFSGMERKNGGSARDMYEGLMYKQGDMFDDLISRLSEEEQKLLSTLNDTREKRRKLGLKGND